MPLLVGYLMANASGNAKDTSSLVKAQCSVCGEKYGSIERARECERRHIQTQLSGSLSNGISSDGKKL